MEVLVYFDSVHISFIAFPLSSKMTCQLFSLLQQGILPVSGCYTYHLVHLVNIPTTVCFTYCVFQYCCPGDMVVAMLK